MNRTELEGNLAKRSQQDRSSIYDTAFGVVGKRLAAFLEAEEGSPEADRLKKRLRHAEDVVMAAGSMRPVIVVRGGLRR